MNDNNDNKVGKLCLWGLEEDVRKIQGLVIPIERFLDKNHVVYKIYRVKDGMFLEASERSLMTV